MDTLIYSEVPVWLIGQLVDIHVDVAISANAGTVWPDDPGILDERVGLAVQGIIVVNGIVRRHQLVNQSITVTFETIGIATALAVRADVGVRVDFGEGIGVWRSQIQGRDRVENVARQRRVVHVLPIGRERDAIEALQLPHDGRAFLAEVERVALVGRHVLRDAEHRYVLRQSAPRLARAEIEHDEARPAFVGAVDEVGDSLARLGAIRVQVEPQVVEVRVWIVDGRGEGEGLVYGVVGQRDRNDLWATRLCVGHRGIALRVVDRRPSRVEHPERLGSWEHAVVGGWRDPYCLNRDEACRIATAKRDAIPGGVELSDGQIQTEIWIRLLCGFVDDYTKRVPVSAAGVRGEDAAIRGNCNAYRPLVVVYCATVSGMFASITCLVWGTIQ